MSSLARAPPSIAGFLNPNGRSQSGGVNEPWKCSPTVSSSFCFHRIRFSKQKLDINWSGPQLFVPTCCSPAFRWFYRVVYHGESFVFMLCVTRIPYPWNNRGSMRKLYAEGVLNTGCWFWIWLWWFRKRSFCVSFYSASTLAEYRTRLSWLTCNLIFTLSSQ